MYNIMSVVFQYLFIFCFYFLAGYIYIEKAIHKVILFLAGIRHLACFPNYATLSL